VEKKIHITITDCVSCPSSVDDDEGNTYKVTELAGLCWTENLRSTRDCEGHIITWVESYNTPEYPASTKRDTMFGKLYTWYSAVGVDEGDDITPPATIVDDFVRGICPCGYHLPSKAEWALLGPEHYNYDTKKLKSKDPAYWLTPGTDDYDWEARGAGWYSGEIGKFIDMLGRARWWASNSSPNQYTDSFTIEYWCADPKEGKNLKTDGLSVRCILDYD
jgi:uncharacterized protein (TIGR02145 family)